MKLTPQILIENGFVAGLTTDKIKCYCKYSDFFKEHLSICYKVYIDTISLLFAPIAHDNFLNVVCYANTFTVEKFNNLMDICNLQEFKLHADKPQKAQGWIVNLDKFNIKAEYFKTAKMLKTWFLGFIRNVYKDDVLRLNNLQFEHVKDGRTVAYFTFKADTQTFSKIFKAN